MTFREIGEFTGICELGPHQLVECYGKYACDYNEYTAVDFMNMCRNCPYENKGAFGFRDPFAYKRSMFNAYDLKTWLVPECNKDPKAFVYFIADEGNAVKIGVAKNIRIRLNELQTGNPDELQVIAAIPHENSKTAYETEYKLHTLYRDYKIRGEWYSIKKQVLLGDFQQIFSPKWADEEA